MVWVVIFFALLIGFLYMVWAKGEAADRAAEKAALELENAQKRYKKSLKDLKNDPSNSDLRQLALELGRQYANLTRTNNARTIFDEVALANDINAASGTTNSSNTIKLAQRPLEDAGVRLIKLQNLKDQGLIDEHEFQQRRKEILQQI